MSHTGPSYNYVIQHDYHTQLCHTTPWSHKTLSQHHCHTWLCHTYLCHRKLSHTSALSHTTLSHTASMHLCNAHLPRNPSSTTSFPFTAVPTSFSPLLRAQWKKLTCVSVRSFNSCLKKKERRQHYDYFKETHFFKQEAPVDNFNGRKGPRKST